MSLSISIDFHVRFGKKGLASKRAFISQQFLTEASTMVENLKSVVSKATTDNYFTALRSFGRYLEISGTGRYLSIGSIDAELVRGYERWLREMNINPNTSSCYMRSLRALLSKLSGVDARNLFQQVYTGQSCTEKRSIEEWQIAKIRDLYLNPNSFLQVVRDVFMFSFYAMGMPFIDIAFLRRNQIVGNNIIYLRHKTGQRVVVPLMPQMKEIINRYVQSESDYVFSLINRDDTRGAYVSYQYMLNRYNRGLKQLAQIAGLSCQLTSYTARHTWASMAYSHNVDLPVISKALGHTKTQTTLIYIRQINDDRIIDASTRVIESI